MISLFETYDHQELSDLRYGGQLSSCTRVGQQSASDEDSSITGDWTAEQD